jgi:hypothetical protein
MEIEKILPPSYKQTLMQNLEDEDGADIFELARERNQKVT